MNLCKDTLPMAFANVQESLKSIDQWRDKQGCSISVRVGATNAVLAVHGILRLGSIGKQV